MKGPRRHRHRYRGRLAQPLRPGEAINDKLELLLQDLGATDIQEGFVKLAERHVQGFKRGSRAGGLRHIDPGTEAQFFELVDCELRDAERAGKYLSVRRAVKQIWEEAEPNQRVRELTQETWYTHYKNRQERELTYQNALEAQRKSLRDWFVRNKEKVSKSTPGKIEERKLAGAALDRLLGQPEDVPLWRKRKRRGAR